MTQRTLIMLMVVMLLAGCSATDPVPTPQEAAQSKSTPVVEAPTPTPTIAVSTPVYGDVTAAAETTPIIPTNVPIPTPAPDDPIRIESIADGIAWPFYPRQMVEAAELIVIGRVVEFLPPQWTTPDGKRPENPWRTVPGQYTIVTPAVFQLDELPLYDPNHRYAAAGTVVVATPGGQIGEDVVVEHFAPPQQPLTTGARMLIVLAEQSYELRTGPIETLMGLAWGTYVEYELTDDGRALSYAGEIQQSSDELIAAIVAAINAQPGAVIEPPPAFKPGWPWSGYSQDGEPAINEEQAAGFTAFPIAWLGPAFDDYNLQNITEVDSGLAADVPKEPSTGVLELVYGDCITPAEYPNCTPPINITNASLCSVSLDARPSAELATILDGALLEQLQDGTVNVWGSRTLITIRAVPRWLSIEDIIAQLTILNAGATTIEGLGAPDFSGCE